MAHKNFSQTSFTDLMINLKKGLNESLDKVNVLINWKPIEQLLAVIYNSSRGPKSYPPLFPFLRLCLSKHGMTCQIIS